VKKVLFVCVGNTCRSQMAKGFFNTLTKSDSADSAGTQPGDIVNPSAVFVMSEAGIDISGYTPKALTAAMNDTFEYIITIGCSGNCPVIAREKAIAWSIDDPFGKSLDTYRRVRDNIRIHVIRLIPDCMDEER